MYTIEDILKLSKARPDIRIHMTIEDYGDNSPQKCMLMLPLVGVSNNIMQYKSKDMGFYVRSLATKNIKGLFNKIKAFFSNRHEALKEFNSFFQTKSKMDNDFFEMEYRDCSMLFYPIFIYKCIDISTLFHGYSTELSYLIYVTAKLKWTDYAKQNSLL